MAGPRNILITGGTSGIGLALVKRLAKRHRVIVTGRSLSAELKELMALMPDLDFVPVDQSDPQAAAKAIRMALVKRNWDKLDNCILNAGTGWVGEPHTQSAQSIADVLNVNVTSSMAIAHKLFPMLEKAVGRITFVGSTTRKNAPDFACYAASKAALHGFARALKEEWSGRVFVQILHPGPTKTDMHKKLGFEPGLARMLFLNVDDVAAMMEKEIRRGRPFRNLNHFAFWNGASLLGRGL